MTLPIDLIVTFWKLIQLNTKITVYKNKSFKINQLISNKNHKIIIDSLIIDSLIPIMILILYRNNPNKPLNSIKNNLR